MSTKEQLLDAAKSIRDNSYSPYSNYKVACAAVTDDGKVFTGVNVENASYGGTNCAERSAIFTAVSEGQRHFKEFLVLVDEVEPWAPCGLCRQVMLEFSSPDTKVYLANLDGVKTELTMKELFPYTFSKSQLKK